MKKEKVRVTVIPDGIRMSEGSKEIDLTWEEAKTLIGRIAEKLPTICRSGRYSSR